MQDLVAGGVDIVTCSLPEARALIEAGKAQAARGDGRQADRAVPGRADDAAGAGHELTRCAAWRGIAGPKGMPADVSAKLIATIKKICGQQGVEGLRGEQGLRHGVGAVGAEFATFMATGDAAMGKTMKAVGLAK